MVVALAGVADQGVEGTSMMENELRAILASGRVPKNLRIAYDDTHGLWGGSLLTVRGDGRIEQQVRVRGASTPTASRRQTGERELLELVRLLVELSIWEQRTPETQPLPDESRPQLTIRVNDETCRVWERSTEMLATNRLLQIKSLIQDQFR
jgi:hypothetical protein